MIAIIRFYRRICIVKIVEQDVNMLVKNSEPHGCGAHSDLPCEVRKFSFILLVYHRCWCCYCILVPPKVVFVMSSEKVWMYLVGFQLNLIDLAVYHKCNCTWLVQLYLVGGLYLILGVTVARWCSCIS